MEKNKLKKSFVLGVLFILPLVAYLFFASGVNNFGLLPTLTKSINDLPKNAASISLDGRITILGFLGNDLDRRQVNMFNLNQKIHKRFSEFKDFQMVMVLPNGTQDQLAAIMKELGTIGELSAWQFLFLSPSEIQDYFSTLKTPLSLDNTDGLDEVFIIDKALNLRGRDGEDGKDFHYGYDATKVSELTNAMIDDVKIILAEYRMALKRNNIYNNK